MASSTFNVARYAAATLLVLCSLVCAQGTSPPAYPSNSSSYVFTPNATAQLVLGVESNTGTFFDLNLFALTPQAYGAVDHGANALDGIGNGIADQLSTTDNNLTVIASGGPIAYIPCDNASYSGNIQLVDVVEAAIGPMGNASAIVFYSTTASFCNLTTNLTGTLASFNAYYTMTSANDSQKVLQGLESASPPGRLNSSIFTSQSWSNVLKANASPSANAFNNPEAGTQVAMIILYSITGVIALLFVVIIVTGAIRAHRHPERYGPRNVVGRPRQTRAQGIGRALLETIPLVKFGEDTPAKPTDVELGPVEGHTEGENAAAPDAERGAQASGEDAGEAAGSSAAHSGDSKTADTPQAQGSGAATTVTAEAPGKNVAGMTHPERVEKSLECAICWEDFEKGEEVRMLPCEHKFHPKCIDPWLLGFSGTCPVCRVDFGNSSKEAKPEDSHSRARSPSQSQPQS